MTSTEAQACPATSIPACFRASHLDHVTSKATRLIFQSLPTSHPCQCHLGYFPSLGSPSPSQHQVQPLLSKLLSIPMHHWVPTFFLSPIREQCTIFSWTRCKVRQKGCASQGRVCQNLGCLKWKGIPDDSGGSPP